MVSAVRTVTAALVVVLTAVTASAQAPVSRRVEFDEAVRLALERNPTVATASAAIARAEAVVDQTRAATFPAVSAGVTNITLDQARGFSGGVTQPQNQFAFSATASLPLWPRFTPPPPRTFCAPRSCCAMRRRGFAWRT